MRRNVLTSLEGLNFATREAAREAARRSGLSLEDWAASVTEQSSRGIDPEGFSRRPADDLEAAIAKIGKVTRQQASSDFEAVIAAAAADSERHARDHAARTAVALDSVASWIEQAEHRLNDATRTATDQQDRLASALTEALGAIKGRLDAVERHVTAEHPVGRRNQSSEQTSPPVLDAVAALRADMARLAGSRDQPKEDPWMPVVDRIRVDLEHLQESLRGLATREEVAALEGLVRVLADDLSQGRADDQTPVLVGSIADLQRQVHRLSEEIGDGVHRRVAAEMEALARKIDLAAANGVERAVIEALSHRVAEIREALARMAEPQRVERLSEDVKALGRQMAELRSNQVGRNDFASFKSALEDIRAVLKRSEEAKSSADVPNQLQSLSRRLDVLVNRPAPANVDPISQQLAVLTERMATLAAMGAEPPAAWTGAMERLSERVEAVAEELARAPKPLIERFDRLEEGLQNIGQQADTANIELMLRSLGEKLDRAPVHQVSLDYLEEKIEALSGQLRSISTPEPLQRTVNETLAQVKSLRDEALQIAERAAKAAVAEAAVTQGTNGALSGTAEIDALKQGFAELKALHSSADKKTQQTLKAVHNALETLVMRPPVTAQASKTGSPADPPEPAKHQGESPSPTVRLEAAVRKLHAAALSQADAITAPPPPFPTDDDEILLEPGTPRPLGAPGTSFTASDQTDPGAVRASFIAAARRAAQAQNGEPGATATEEGEDRGLSRPVISNQTLIERIRQTFDTHRRPLLLGLAVLILAAGTMQVATTIRAPDTPAADNTSVAEPAPEHPLANISPRSDASADQADPASPAVTGSLLDPTATTAAPLPSGAFIAPVKRIADMGGLGELPAALPEALRKAALSGEPSSVYEAASRAVEGRGMPRDPVLAARLFEKAAQAGLAPAQYRLASLYEKGVGVTRDLTQAKTWYERAAEGGNARAMHNLAVLFAEGADGKPDYAAAQRWFLEAAELGIRDSQYNLGVLLARGLGTRQDLAQSYKWFALAAAQGDEDAGRKRDEIAARLTPGDLVAAKASVERWRARSADPLAQGATPVQDLSAATPRIVNGRG